MKLFGKLFGKRKAEAKRETVEVPDFRLSTGREVKDKPRGGFGGKNAGVKLRRKIGRGFDVRKTKAASRG